jgi:hypothetical protein
VCRPSDVRVRVLVQSAAAPPPAALPQMWRWHTEKVVHRSQLRAREKSSWAHPSSRRTSWSSGVYRSAAMRSHRRAGHRQRPSAVHLARRRGSPASRPLRPALRPTRSPARSASSHRVRPARRAAMVKRWWRAESPARAAMNAPPSQRCQRATAMTPDCRASPPSGSCDGACV